MRQAALEPGSVDLELLLQRLLALRPSWRGHEQGKPLALAYDWLYGQWSETQRLQLREKTIEVCDYLVDWIRKERATDKRLPVQRAAAGTDGVQPRAL